jgi:hypothetical protein
MPPPKDPEKVSEWKRKLSEFNKGHVPWNKGKKRPEMSGEKHPNYNGALCTAGWRKKQSDAHIGLQSGDKHPNWKGGVSFEPYCPKFNERFRTRVRAWYNNMCVECKTTREENGEELSVHHVNFDKQTCCREGEKVTDQKFVALCVLCHSYATHHQDWAIEHYTRIINEVYGGKSYLTEEEYIKDSKKLPKIPKCSYSYTTKRYSCMTKLVSGRPLKKSVPHWYCRAEPIGDVRALAVSGVQLNYVTEPREMASVWRYLGNPKFRVDYDYLLVSVPTSEITTIDVYAVKLPRRAGETTRKRNLFAGHFDAFAGTVDRIVYGWATHSAIKAMNETAAESGASPF